jgi:dTDP-4-dehydrorhamnose reductase
MRLLVTGANGLVGRRLVRQLAQAGHEVVATGRGAPRWQLPPERVRWASVDLGDGAALFDLVTRAEPMCVVNPGGMTDVDGCERDPQAAWAANVEGVATLCRAVKALGAKLVHVSTDYVFDGEAGPYAVDAVPNPRGVYALSKHVGEQTVRALLPAERQVIARTAVVHGWPNVGKNNFGSWLLETLAKGQPVKAFADQWVSPSWAGNVAAMLAELALGPHHGVFHTCGAEVVDRVTFTQRLAERFGFDRALVVPSRMADVKLLSPRPARSGLDVSKTVAALKTSPMTIAQQLEALEHEYRSTTP